LKIKLSDITLGYTILATLIFIILLFPTKEQEKEPKPIQALSSYTIEEYPREHIYNVAYKEVTIKGYNYIMAITDYGVAVCLSLNQKIKE
jgi:hypothetical protein